MLRPGERERHADPTLPPGLPREPYGTPQERLENALVEFTIPVRMPASETPSSTALAHDEADTRPSHAIVTSEARWVGIAVLVFAGALALTAVAAGVVFTTPSQSLCPPANGNGQDGPCPPGPLTTNNMFVVLTFVILSAVFCALGILVEIMVWFRANPNN